MWQPRLYRFHSCLHFWTHFISLPFSLCPIHDTLPVPKTTGPLHVLISLSRKVFIHPYTPAHSTGPYIIYWINSYSDSALSSKITCSKKSCLIFPLLYLLHVDQSGFFCNKFLWEPCSFFFFSRKSVSVGINTLFMWPSVYCLPVSLLCKHHKSKDHIDFYKPGFPQSLVWCWHTE